MRISFYSYLILSVRKAYDFRECEILTLYNYGEIGYTRIILASLSLYYMPWHPKVCVSLYCISCLLDAVDGNAARYYNQCKFFILSMRIAKCIEYDTSQAVDSVLYWIW